MDAIKFGLLLIVFFALNLTLPAQTPMSEPEVQCERKISRPKKKASLSGVILEYNPLTQTVDTLDPRNSDFLGLTIRRKKEKVPNAEKILPIIIIRDDEESRFIKYVFYQEGVKSISANDFIFSGTGYICLSPDMFPISKDPEHADLVFIAKNDWYFYEKIGNDIAKQLNAFKASQDTVIFISDQLSVTRITYKPKAVYPTVEDINDNLNKTCQILQNNSSLKLIIEVYEGIYDNTSKEEEVQARELARQRSVILRDFFLDFIPPEQIETACYAVSDPQAPAQSELRNGVAIFRIVKR